MVTFKGGWGKLYYTQHTLLSNVGQLPFFFLRNKHSHKGEGNEFLHKDTPQFHLKAMVTFKGE